MSAYTLMLLLSAAMQQPSSDSLAPSAGDADTSADRVHAVVADTDERMRQGKNEIELRTASHANEYYRVRGASAAAEGRWERAIEMFTVSARYADKYSQHRLSLLYWHGVGTAEDRVEGYIWADLAAERGYPQFLAIREKMWSRLSEAERAQVAERGPARYAKYGDPAGKKRFNVAMVQLRHHRITGSRAGYVGFVGTSSPEFLSEHLRMFGVGSAADTGALGIVFKPERLNPTLYWEKEDKIWREGLVSVGEIEGTGRAPAKKAKGKP